MKEPSVLILDNPFIGLDAASRQLLDDMLKMLCQKRGLQVILGLSQLKDLPEWIDHILPISGMECLESRTRKDFLSDHELQNILFPDIFCGEVSLPAGKMLTEDHPYTEVLNMEKVHITYSGITILKDLDWTVNRGEKWALLGGNGSGKSTLLSLVCGDNPQAYANKMSLFGRRRGTGESIWEIKRHIGYLSADMHAYYMEDIPCLKVVSSGFYDSIGLFRPCSEEQYRTAMDWMKVFHADYLADRSFVKISYGEQRLVLLVRAFIKNPELLILDEPLHGLDSGKKCLAYKIIEKFCSDPDRTLIYVSHYKDEIPRIVNKEKILNKI